MKNTYDVIIIGSGIVGSLIARYLSHYDLKILVIEKEIDVGMCPSSANSAIIHSGADPKPGSMKARMNAEGNRLWHSLAPELGIQFKKTGSYVVAIGEKEKEALPALLSRAKANNIPGVEIVGREKFLEHEPLANPEASGALYAPSAAVIDPFGATLAAAENAVVNGVTYSFETEFLDFIFSRDSTPVLSETGFDALVGDAHPRVPKNADSAGYSPAKHAVRSQDALSLQESGTHGSASPTRSIIGVKTSKGDFFCKWAINSAGLYSDEVAHKAGIRKDFGIIPSKGSYLIFDAAKITLNSILFPVPQENTKGILVSTTTHGNVLIGPDREPASGRDDTSTTETGFAKILAGAKKLVPAIDAKNAIASYAGVRATGNGGRDFIIEIPEEVRGLVNLCGIDSPGLASAPAIALYVVELIQSKIQNLKSKITWNPVRKPFPHFHLMTNEQKIGLVKENPAYGRIVCRCEEITEGEVLDAIHSPVPARTYDGIKRRTWLGTGRCQGAFDYPRVIELLARELKIPVTEVTKKGKGSELVFRKTKQL